MDHNKKLIDVDGQNAIKDTKKNDIFEEPETSSSDLVIYASSMFFQYFPSVVIPAIFLMFGLLLLVLMLYSDVNLPDILLVIFITIIVENVLTNLDKNDTS